MLKCYSSNESMSHFIIILIICSKSMNFGNKILSGACVFYEFFSILVQLDNLLLLCIVSDMTGVFGIGHCDLQLQSGFVSC